MSEATPRYAPAKDLSKFALLSIAAALLTMALKAGAAYLTGSVGLLSDAMESGVNLVAAIVAFIVLKIAIKPPDHNHHFGHTKAEYFSAVVEGVMIFFAAGLIIYAAIDRMIHPRMPEQLDIGLAISVVAGLIHGAVAMVLLKQAKIHRSATLEADGKHLMTDVITSVAVLVGVGLVALTKIQILDPIVALLAGINILWQGFGLIKQSTAGLMDGAVPVETQEDVQRVLDSFRKPNEIEFHALRTRQGGTRQFMEFHILVPGDWSVKKGHDLTEQVIDAVIEAIPDMRVSAHLEPIEDPKSYDDEMDYA